MSSSKSGIVSFVNCQKCVSFGYQPDLDIGASRGGALVVWCRRHGCLVVRIENIDLSETLDAMAGHVCKHGVEI